MRWRHQPHGNRMAHSYFIAAQSCIRYANWSTHRDVRDIYTADFALAWSPIPNFQLDIGVNVGRVPAAPPYQIYAGIAQRF